MPKTQNKRGREVVVTKLEFSLEKKGFKFSSVGWDGWGCFFLVMNAQTKYFFHCHGQKPKRAGKRKEPPEKTRKKGFKHETTRLSLANLFGRKAPTKKGEKKNARLVSYCAGIFPSFLGGLGSNIARNPNRRGKGKKKK